MTYETVLNWINVNFGAANSNFILALPIITFFALSLIGKLRFSRSSGLAVHENRAINFLNIGAFFIAMFIALTTIAVLAQTIFHIDTQMYFHNAYQLIT